MDKKEKEDDLKTEIRDDAEKGEKVSDEEDKDYKKDADKHTEDREKTIKDDAEKSERVNDEEDKDYDKLHKLEDGDGGKTVDEDRNLDNRYISKEQGMDFERRLKSLEEKFGGSDDAKNPYDEFRMEIKDNPIE